MEKERVTWWRDHQLRTWAGSAAYIVVVLVILGLLMRLEIPPKNRDTVMLIVGVFASGVAPAVSRLVGRRMGDG